VYVIGVVEVVGGTMLLLGRGVRLAAIILAGDMVGAIVVSGLGEWETISLTLAPLLLAGGSYLPPTSRSPRDEPSPESSRAAVRRDPALASRSPAQPRSR